MSEKLKPSELLGSINLPKQDRAKLVFCNSAKTSAVREWVDSLQATKIMQTSGKLYIAAPEIARLKTDFETRFEMLEVLRPVVHNATMGLEKSFLNQPLILPEEAQKALVVAQSLKKNMLDGYLATVIQIAENAKASKPIFSLLSEAIHRAITNIGNIFFRNYQIYSQTPAMLWSTLHILYQVARFYDLTQQPVVDKSLRSVRALSIEAAYARVLMLATARTNQLTQSEIEACFLVFESWCQSVKLRDELSDDAENFFAVNLLSSGGPLYKSQLKDVRPEACLEVDFRGLLSILSKQSTSSDEVLGSASAVKVPKEFSSNLLEHLIETWSNVARRKHERKIVEAGAEVCVGITDVHYCICNGQTFEYFLRSSGNAEGQKISRFSQGLTPASHIDDYQNSFVPVYRVVIQNVSAGGYCMLWQQDISNKVGAGEIIAVKEIGQRTWSIGLIRWVRQLRNASQLGVQLVANNAKPFGVAQAYESGGYSEYMRAFFIPPSKLGHSHPTLLTASAPLSEFDKVRFVDGEKEWKAKLERVVFSTKSMQQFRFRNLDTAADDKSSPNTDSKPRDRGFDSTWDE